MASLAALGGYCDSSSSDEDDDNTNCESEKELKDENKEVLTTSSSSSKDNNKLPSAELLLESTDTPSWLQQQQQGQNTTVEPIHAETTIPDTNNMFDSRKRKTTEANSIASLSPEHSSPRTKEPSSSHVMAPPRVLSNTEKRAMGHELAKLKSENERGKEKSAATKSAKERTKQQRIKGQSGIGESFRTWRSDEEMLMRNQDIG